MEFNKETLAALATKSILESMTQQHRDELLASAVAQLFEPAKRDPYSNDKRTVFQVAFDEALSTNVHKSVKEILAEEQFQSVLRPLIAGAVEIAMGAENRARLAGFLANAIDEAMTKLRGY